MTKNVTDVKNYVTDSTNCTVFLTIRVGMKSQWGKIKANLVSESVNTPLQDKLEEMAGLVSMSGICCVGVLYANY